MTFINSPGFSKYFANTSWLLAERILRMVINLFVGIYVARYLGPMRFGEFSYAQSFVALFSAIALLGLDSIVVRELVKTPERRDELLGTSFWLKVAGAILVLSILFVCLQLTRHNTEENILIFIIATGLLFQSTNVIDFYFQSTVLSKYVVQAQLVQVVISSIAKILLIWIEAPLLWFAVATTADSIVLAVGLLINYFRHSNLRTRWLFCFQTAKELLRDSWPLILASISVSIYMRIDQVMIKTMLDASAVGQYAAAVRISEAWYFIPMTITSSLFPAIINSKKICEEIYYRRLQQLYDLMVWLAIAIALPMTLMSDWIIDVLFGSQYKYSGNVLAIHIWAGVFVGLGVASGKWLVAENKIKHNFYRTSVGLVVNILLNWMLIRTHGVVGAAISTVVSYIVADYMYDYINADIRECFYMKSKSLVGGWL